MTQDISEELSKAIAKRDPRELHQLIQGAEFILLRVFDEPDAQDDASGALTANVEDFDVLVVFTSEEKATCFAATMADLFDADEEVEGFVVEGQEITRYLPSDFGLLINPENEHAVVMEPFLIALVNAIQDEAKAASDKSETDNDE